MSAPTSSISPLPVSEDGAQIRAYRLPPQVGVLLVCVAAAVVVPLVVEGSTLFLVTTAVIYALFAMGTNVLFGWTGIASFGQAAFFGAGAYAVGLTKDHVGSPVLAVLVAAVAAGVIALGFALLSMRVTGVEFAMLTLIVGQILWLLTFRIDSLQGDNGIQGVSRGELFGQNLFLDSSYWWFVVAVATVVLLVLNRIRRSSFGASMNAVQDDPIRAAALGINVTLVRVMAFTLAGVVAGLAGGLMAQQQGLVTPDLLLWSLSGEVIVMCLIGGIRTFWGPVVGAVLLTVGQHYLLDRVSFPDLIIGAALMLVVLVLPGGLLSVTSPLRRLVRKENR